VGGGAEAVCSVVTADITVATYKHLEAAANRQAGRQAEDDVCYPGGWVVFFCEAAGSAGQQQGLQSICGFNFITDALCQTRILLVGT
jgi:hypothetical protein